MNRNDLFKSFNELDDDIIKRSESAVSNKKYPAPLRWGTLAAGILILLVMIAPLINLNANNSSTGTFNPQTNTSDTYSNLTELLEYLSTNEKHDTLDGLKGGNSHTATPIELQDNHKSKLVNGTTAVLNSTEKYVYHIKNSNEINISQISDKNTKNIGCIKNEETFWIGELYLCNNSLITVSSGYSNGSYTKVRIYDITDPYQPVLEDEFSQSGVYVKSWMVGNNIYLVTDDGECACGYSRTDDIFNYYPTLYHNNKSIEWGDDDIAILGEPSLIAYTSISVINTQTRKTEYKTALYGDISDIYYGENWITVIIKNLPTLPTLYTFDKDLTFTGKINISEIVNELNAKGDIYSITKVGNTYRMIGTYRTTSMLNSEEYYMAISADIYTKKYRIATLPVTKYSGLPYTEILWEQNRAIICALKDKENIIEYSSDTQEIKFMFVEFFSTAINFYDSTLTSEFINGGIPKIIYGSPLGEFETLIAMGNGIYVRYSHYEKVPGGFEVYDFSSSSSPKRIWRAETSLSGADAFEYYWKIYDKNTFGTLKVYLSTGDTDYWRKVKLSWCIYSVNPDNKNVVTLKKEYPLNIEATDFYSAESIKFEIFTVENSLYYVSKYNDTVQKTE